MVSGAGARIENGRTHILSPDERRSGLHYYERYSFWNGLGVTFLNSSIISLMAIYFGASNLQLGYISSVFHFAGIILVFIPKLLHGFNIGRVFSLAWLIRGLVCFLYGLLFFLDGQSAVACIMVLYTLFAVSRAVGMPMSQPLQRSIFQRSGEGEAVVRIHLRLSVSEIISRVVSFVLLSVQALSGLVGLVILTWIGATNNTVAALYIKRVPSRERVDYRRGKNIFVVFVETLRHPVRGRILITRILDLGSGILLTFGIAYCSRAVGMPDNMVFVYALAGAVGALVGTHALRPFVDSIGSKPLLLMTSGLLAAVSIVWVFLPVTLPWAVYYSLGFLTLLLQRIRLLLLSRLIIKTLPNKDTVSYTAMLSFASAVFGLTVGLIGGGLADLSAAGRLPSVHMYSYTYGLAGILSFASGLAARRISDPGSLSFKEAAAALLSVKTLRAYLDIYQLGTVVDTQKREARLQSLEQNDADIATEELRLRLKTPLPGNKERILRSLLDFPRRELREDILLEAQDRYSYNRRDAVKALAAYDGRKTRRALLSMLDDPDHAVAAAAVETLAKLGDREHADVALKLATVDAPDGRTGIDALRALAAMDNGGEYAALAFELARPERGRRYLQLSLVVWAEQLNLNPELSTYFAETNRDPVAGFGELVSDTHEVPAFLDDSRLLRNLYRRRCYADIWDWCTRRLELYTPAPRFSGLYRAIANGRPPALNADTALAALYYTYHIISAAHSS